VIVTSMGELMGLKGVLVNFVVRRVKKMVKPWSIPSAIHLSDALADGPAAHAAARADRARRHRVPAVHGRHDGRGEGRDAAAPEHRREPAAGARVAVGRARPATREIIITPLPLYHIFSLTANCLVFMTLGAENVLIPNPRDIPGFIKTLRKVPFTAFTGVNTLFNALVNNPAFAQLSFKPLRLVLGGGMAVQEAVAKKWKQITGVPLIEAYGLTETSPAATINPLNLTEYNGSIGCRCRRPTSCCATTPARTCRSARPARSASRARR
jgi:long-chain acyl-CoA synthetase